jgi:hypothetical protein
MVPPDVRSFPGGEAATRVAGPDAATHVSAQEDAMPSKRDDPRRDETPRTDLPPEREPYYEGYFGTDEEEGVERERDEPSDVRPSREAAEDAAGGDREI